MHRRMLPPVASRPQHRSHAMLLNRNHSKFPELETRTGLTLKNEKFTFHSKCIFVCDFVPLSSHNPTTKLSLFCSPTAWCNKLLHLSPAYVGFTLCWDERAAALLTIPSTNGGVALPLECGITVTLCVCVCVWCQVSHQPIDCASSWPEHTFMLCFYNPQKLTSLLNWTRCCLLLFFKLNISFFSLFGGNLVVSIPLIDEDSVSLPARIQLLFNLSRMFLNLFTVELQ